MRILMVSSEFPPSIGGVGSHVFELGRQLYKQGHQVTVLTLPLTGVASSLNDSGQQVLRPPIVRLMPFHDWHLHWYLKRYLSTHPTDIIHVHGLNGAWSASRQSVPALFTNHTSGFLRRLQSHPIRRWRTRNRIAGMKAIIAPSEELCEGVRQLKLDCPISYIPNGVDEVRFSPGTSLLRQQLLQGKQAAIMLLARRLVEKNGVREFMEALLHVRGENVLAVIAGDGPERQWMEDFANSQKLTEMVRFLGAVGNNQMPELYRSVDFSVLPSRMEATSIAGLEAMASSLPLIGTKVGGIPALIQQDINGYLVTPNDTQALARAMRMLIRVDDQTRCQMGAASRARVLDHFCWRQIAADTVKVYRRVVESR